MAKNLIIVESPAKAKTINKFLGDEFVVTSCYGHIRDLPDGGLNIDIANNYTPNYEVSDDKKDVIKELKKLAKGAKDIYLATDEDREGEAISWHLCDVLGLNPANAKRITYTEVTEKAIKDAVAHPRTINMDLVNAQQARRVLDRLVGYEISPVLWRKVKPSLSAGRVQSVAVRLIVEREREIRGFKPVASYKIQAYFFLTDKNGKKSVFKAERPSNFKTQAEAEKFLNELVSAEFKVSAIEKKPGKRTPAAPFTTSTLQQEASRKLGFSVSKTMLMAQKLYENGHITYMRTDSVHLSDTALDAIEKEIKSKYGKQFHQKRVFTNKNESAQEAHEAIRPSLIENATVEAEYDESRLYELIWKRSIASQMADAEIEKTTIDIVNNKNKEVLKALAEVILFEGFLKVYNESQDEEGDDEEKESQIPPVKEGQVLELKEMNATERFTKPLPRYTEASLVKKLEELGIGRPSTYAPTIGTIQKRNYVLKENRDGMERKYKVMTLTGGKVTTHQETENVGAEKSKLFPTDIGLLVTDFLVENFKNVLDYNFTADVELQFDKVADGKKVWSKMIDDFYKPFHETVETTTKDAQRVSGEKLLGTDPASGLPLIVRMGKFGPMAQIGKTEEGSEKKARYAKLRANQSIETITFEEALELFKLPRVLGQLDGKDIKASIGRFGPYVQQDKLFVSIPKDKDPYTITFEDALTLIRAKAEADANKLIHNFENEGIQVLNGRYGPYIKKGKDNYKIPKGTSPEHLTLEEVMMIIGEQGTDKKILQRRKKIMAKKSEISALIQLLDDDDQEVFKHVHDKLKSYGPEVIPDLEEVWTDELNSTTHERLEEIIHEIQYECLLTDWQTWLDRESPDLLTGAFLVAQYHYPEIKFEDTLKKIAKLKQGIWLELNYNQTPLEQVQIFNQVFYAHHEFKGVQSVNEYHDLCINHVLDSKSGSPIVTGIIYQVLANELNLPVYGVNLTRHYILAFCKRTILDFSMDENNEKEVMFYINPINRGSIFSRNEIKDYLDKLKMEHEPNFFTPADNKLIIKELLNYLADVYTRQNNTSRVREINYLLQLM